MKKAYKWNKKKFFKNILKLFASITIILIIDILLAITILNMPVITW